MCVEKGCAAGGRGCGPGKPTGDPALPLRAPCPAPSAALVAQRSKRLRRHVRASGQARSGRPARPESRLALAGQQVGSRITFGHRDRLQDGQRCQGQRRVGPQQAHDGQEALPEA